MPANVSKQRKGRFPDGRLGCLRLWVPAVEMDEAKAGRYTDNRVSQGSRQFKKLSDEDVADLQDLAVTKSTDDAFLRGQRKREAPSSASASSAGKAARLFDVDSSDGTNPSPVKVVDIALEKPKQISKHAGEIGTIQASLLEVAKKACEHLKGTTGPQDPSSPSSVLLSHLKFRISCVAALLNYEQKLISFMDPDLVSSEQLSIAQLLRRNPEKLPVPQELSGFLSDALPGLRKAFQTAVQACGAVQELEQAKEEWGNQKSALQALLKGLQQALKDSKAYVAQEERDKTRKQKADQKKREKQELEAFRTTSDSRAKALLEDKKKALGKPSYTAWLSILEDLRNGKLPDGLTTHSFFKVEASSQSLPAMSKPWRVDTDNQRLKSWMADPTMKKTVQSWAMKYKTFPDYASKGRAAATLEPKHGHEVCQSLFAAFVPELADMTSLPQAATFQATTWLAGLSPEMRFGGFQANGCLTVKAAIMGEVLHVCMPISELVQGLTSIGKLAADQKFNDISDFCALMEDLDKDAWIALSKSGVNMYVHQLKPGEMIAVPMAWFCFEISTEGTVLVLVRQGIFLKNTSETELAEYKSLTELMARCGRSIDRYQQALDLLSKSAAAEQPAA